MSIYRIEMVAGEPVVKDFMSGREVRDRVSRMVLFTAGKLGHKEALELIQEFPASQKKVLVACFASDG